MVYFLSSFPSICHPKNLQSSFFPVFATEYSVFATECHKFSPLLVAIDGKNSGNLSSSIICHYFPSNSTTYHRFSLNFMALDGIWWQIDGKSMESMALLQKGYDIFEELFYSLSRKFLKVCSGSVLEKANVYSRTVLEQTIRTFLELFWNHSKNVLE